MSNLVNEASPLYINNMNDYKKQRHRRRHHRRGYKGITTSDTLLNNDINKNEEDTNIINDEIKDEINKIKDHLNDESIRLIDCYICYESMGEKEYYACKCRFGNVHKECIERWISRGNMKCRICNTYYKREKRSIWKRCKSVLNYLKYLCIGILCIPIVIIILGIPIIIILILI